MIHYIFGGYLAIAVILWAVLWRVTRMGAEGAFLLLPCLVWPVGLVILALELIDGWLKGN